MPPSVPTGMKGKRPNDMGTERWYPGMNERRDGEVRNELLEAVEQIRRDTSEIKTALFGIPGQEYLAHIPRTERRLGELDDPQTGRVTKIERRILIWIGAMSIVGPMAALAVNYIFR